MKNRIMLSFGTLLFLSTTMHGKSVMVTNNTNDFLCVGFGKTKAPSLLGKVGIGKTKENRYEVLYEEVKEGSFSIQTREIAPYQTVHFLSYSSDSSYDRTLWIVNSIKHSNDCNALARVGTEGMSNKKPANAVALEVGSKENVVIMAGGKGYKLERWNAKLGKEIANKKMAMNQALQKLKLRWESLKSASQSKWADIKQAFNKAYKDLEKKATTTTKKIFQTKAEKLAEEKRIASQVEGEEPGAGLNIWAGEGFAIDEGQPGDGSELHMMP